MLYCRRREELLKDPDVNNVMTSLDSAIEFSLGLENRDQFESVWVMGGQVFFEVCGYFLNVFLVQVYNSCYVSNPII